MHAKLFAIIGAFLVFYPAAVHADSSTDDLFSLSLEELMSVKVAIATKQQETLRDSPSSVTVFTRQDIINLGITEWTEIFNQIPGFYSMMNSVEGNQSHLIMRGHAQTYANTLLVLLNGHRLNDDYTGGINYLLRHMNVRDIERIEVIRGPGSALYGSNAFSGVINIITSVEQYASVQVGELGALAGSFGISKDINNWQVGLSAGIYQDDGDELEGVFDRFGLQTSTSDARQVEQYRLYAQTEQSQFFAQYLHSHRDDFYLFRRLRDGVNALDLRHFTAGITHQLIDSDNMKLVGKASYQYASRESLGALAVQGEPPFDNSDFLFGVSFNYRSYDAALDGSYQYRDDILLSAGLSYSNSQVPDAFLKSNFDLYGDFSELADITTFDQPGQRTVLDKQRSILGIYLQGRWHYSNQLAFHLGIRHDEYNDAEHATNPRAAIIYHFDDEQTLKLQYGQAYRVPSLGDLYDEESGLTVGNNELAASEIETLELIYARGTKSHQYSLTVFANEQINIIGFTTDEENRSFLDNVAENQAYGFEMEFKWQPVADFQLKTAYTHLWHNKTDVGSHIGLPMSEYLSPNSYFHFSAQYHHQSLAYNLNGSWRDDVQANDPHSLWLLNAHVAWQFSDDLSLSLAVKNLLDETYTTSAYLSLGRDENGDNAQYFPARGRQALVQLRWSF